MHPASKLEPSMERAYFRLALWQTVLSLIGLFVGVVALYAALTESAAVRQQTAAAVWPYVQMVVSDHRTESSAEFTVSLRNVGVGPARMREARVIIEGRPVADWDAAIAALGGNPAALASRNFITDRVLTPGEKIDMFSTRDRDLVRRLQLMMAEKRSAISYCYCSIFESCWLVDSQREKQRPQPVDACPLFAGAAFGG